jgi:hypothetical protein
MATLRTLGLGILAITTRSLSMTNLKTLFKPPSASSLQARLRPRGFGGDSLQFRNVEPLVPLLATHVFFPEPASTAIPIEVFSDMCGYPMLDLRLL